MIDLEEVVFRENEAMERSKDLKVQFSKGETNFLMIKEKIIATATLIKTHKLAKIENENANKELCLLQEKNEQLLKENHEIIINNMTLKHTCSTLRQENKELKEKNNELLIKEKGMESYVTQLQDLTVSLQSKLEESKCAEKVELSSLKLRCHTIEGLYNKGKVSHEKEIARLYKYLLLFGEKAKEMEMLSRSEKIFYSKFQKEAVKLGMIGDTKVAESGDYGSLEDLDDEVVGPASCASTDTGQGSSMYTSDEEKFPSAATTPTRDYCNSPNHNPLAVSANEKSDSEMFDFETSAELNCMKYFSTIQPSQVNKRLESKGNNGKNCTKVTVGTSPIKELIKDSFANGMNEKLSNKLAEKSFQANKNSSTNCNSSSICEISDKRVNNILKEMKTLCPKLISPIPWDEEKDKDEQAEKKQCKRLTATLKTNQHTNVEKRRKLRYRPVLEDSNLQKIAFYLSQITKKISRKQVKRALNKRISKNKQKQNKVHTKRKEENRVPKNGQVIIMQNLNGNTRYSVPLAPSVLIINSASGTTDHLLTPTKQPQSSDHNSSPKSHKQHTPKSQTKLLSAEKSSPKRNKRNRCSQDLFGESPVKKSAQVLDKKRKHLQRVDSIKQVSPSKRKRKAAIDSPHVDNPWKSSSNNDTGNNVSVLSKSEKINIEKLNKAKEIFAKIKEKEEKSKFKRKIDTPHDVPIEKCTKKCENEKVDKIIEDTSLMPDIDITNCKNLVNNPDNSSTDNHVKIVDKIIESTTPMTCDVNTSSCKNPASTPDNDDADNCKNKVIENASPILPDVNSSGCMIMAGTPANSSSVNHNLPLQNIDKSNDVGHGFSGRTKVCYEDVFADVTNDECGTPLFRSIVQKKLNQKTPKKHGLNKRARVLSYKLEEFLTSEFTAESVDLFMKKLSVEKKNHLMYGVLEFLGKKRETNLEWIIQSPMPGMNVFHQKLLVLINAMVVSKLFPYDIFASIMEGIEYQCFLLNNAPHLTALVSLATFYSVLCRITNNKEKLKVFCMDALYCLSRKGTPLIYAVLQVWPRLLPKAHHFVAKEPLVIVMIHSLLTNFTEDIQYKSKSMQYFLIKNDFKAGEFNNDQVLDILTASLKDLNRRWPPLSLRAAFLVFAKRCGVDFCVKKIVMESLLPLLEDTKLNCDSRIFVAQLIGPLVRPLPTTMKMQCEIVIKTLIKMLHNEDAAFLQEAIIVSLAQLSSKSFFKICEQLMSWQPSSAVSPETIDVFNNIVESKTKPCWKKVMFTFH